MPTADIAIQGLAICIVGTPLALLVLLSFFLLIDRPFAESTTDLFVSSTIFIGLLGAGGMIVVMAWHGTWSLNLELTRLIVLDDYHLSVKLLFDSLSLPFVLLTFVLGGVIARFARRYMHREPGYDRFFTLYALFIAGMALTALAGNIETLFAGWELVGLSSAFLVAFFHERQMPARNGLHVWAVYRVSDAAFLIAAVVMHHMVAAGDFHVLQGNQPWPEGQTLLTEPQALVAGLLLLVAAAGKSALVPFSGWLPRAMEGPTPSSAVFYGAISVHLGAFLLLRVSPILERSLWLCAAVVALGLITAAYAALAGRVQTDIKSALAFASLTQVGIIVAEIGFGLRYLALAHLIGHACMRTLQFLKAPSLLHEYHELESAAGHLLAPAPGLGARLIPDSVRLWFYRFALERGYLDACLAAYVVRPLLAVFHGCDMLERKWTDLLSGGHSRESDRLKRPADSLDELL